MTERVLCGTALGSCSPEETLTLWKVKRLLTSGPTVGDEERIGTTENERVGRLSEAATEDVDEAVLCRLDIDTRLSIDELAIGIETRRLDVGDSMLTKLEAGREVRRLDAAVSVPTEELTTGAEI
jgi:hypothetical protein